jgi:hypothetical protein
MAPDAKIDGPLPLDRFIPCPDVRERFATTVHAPPWLVMRVARDFDLQSVWLVRMIFVLREWIMWSRRAPPRQARGLVDELTTLGWGVLADEGDELLACGAYAQPWKADVGFSSAAPETFAAFARPNLVKIAWTIETRAISDRTTELAHETRAVATDDEARRLFLGYWRWARFGIIAIRWLVLPAIRREAERRRPV